MTMRLRKVDGKHRLAVGMACAMIAIAALAAQGPVAGAAPTGLIAQKIADPAYIHPTADPGAWNQLIASPAASVGIVVANVTNGPDYQPVPVWSSVIQRSHSAGMKVLGYVDSGYLGTTGLPTRLGSAAVADWVAQMEQDINAWYRFYGPNIDGIFFDQGQNQCGSTRGANDWATTYTQMSSLVKSTHPAALTVINPGTAVPQCYESAADVLLTFEGSYSAYTGHPATPAEAYIPLSWDPVDPQKIWHLIYGAGTQAEMEDAIRLSKTRNAGYVYVTDDTLANPWDSLPAQAYWADEQTQAGRLAGPLRHGHRNDCPCSRQSSGSSPPPARG